MKNMSDWVKERTTEKSYELLKGAIDIHVHAGPHLKSSPRGRPGPGRHPGRDAGMRAIVYMDVFEMTTGTAWIVSRVVPDFKVFGGIIMNTVYGGMNPRSVKTAIFYGSGAKYVSFGAHSTYYQAGKEGRVVDGKFSPLKDLYPKFVEEELSRCIEIPLEGKLSPELTEILAMIAANPQIFLNTGHVSPAEAFRLIDLAKQYGIKKVLLANSVVANLSIGGDEAGGGLGGLSGADPGGAHPHDHHSQDPLLCGAGMAGSRRRASGSHIRGAEDDRRTNSGGGPAAFCSGDGFRRLHPPASGGRDAGVHRLHARSGIQRRGRAGDDECQPGEVARFGIKYSHHRGHRVHRD